MILISFEDLQKIHNFSKLQGCGSKIGSATPIWISKFKRAWQTQFLSYNLETLEKWVFFEDVQMILVSFFHIPAGFQLRKNAFQSSVHILRRPWSNWIHFKRDNLFKNGRVVSQKCVLLRIVMYYSLL